jgi:hypothetical protein
MAVHGDIKEITFNHPTVGSGTLFPKANESNTLDTGGYRTNDDANQIVSDGSLILQKNRTRAFFEAMVENDNNLREDMRKVVEITESPLLAEWTISLIGGAIYKGSGQPVGDLQTDLNTGMFTLKVACDRIEKISG